MGGAGQLIQDNWHRDVRTLALLNTVNPRRWGMRVTVYADPVPANNGDYVLEFNRSSTNLQDNGNWLKVADINVTWGGGSGGVDHWRGGYDASTNLYPAAGGSGGGGDPQAGDMWNVTVQGDLDVFGLGVITVFEQAILTALVNSPGQTPANWRVIQ